MGALSKRATAVSHSAASARPSMTTGDIGPAAPRRSFIPVLSIVSHSLAVALIWDILLDNSLLHFPTFLMTMNKKEKPIAWCGEVKIGLRRIVC